MAEDTPTLSKRGRELTSDRLGPNAREATEKIGFYCAPWNAVTNPDGLINLGTAENSLMLDDMAAFIREQNIDFPASSFDYSESWGSPRLRIALAEFLNGHFAPSTPVLAPQLTVANGCSSLFNALGCVLADPGDGLMLSKPGYVAFGGDFGMLGGTTPVYVSTEGIDPFSPDILSCYEEALTSAKQQGVTVKILVLCNPHNPLGRCYPASTLIALLRFCNENKIHLVADEIYAMSVYDVPGEEEATPFVSVLSLEWEKYIDAKFFHHVYGLSKDFACGGLRVGVLYTKSREVERAVTALANFHFSGTVNALLATKILENKSFTSEFLRKSCERIREASLLARTLLDEVGITYLLANAGFFLWVDLGPWLREEDGRDEWARERSLMERLLARRVFLMGGGMQKADRGGWFRFVFTRDEGLVREGVGRIKEVCGIE